MGSSVDNSSRERVETLRGQAFRLITGYVLMYVDLGRKPQVYYLKTISWNTMLGPVYKSLPLVIDSCMNTYPRDPITSIGSNTDWPMPLTWAISGIGLSFYWYELWAIIESNSMF